MERPPSRVSRLFATGLLLGAAQCHALCLNPFGCEPSNYDECVQDATKRPTDVGVRMAMKQCYDKFKRPEEARAAADRAAQADVFAKRWSESAGKATTVAELEQVLKRKGEAAPALQCTPVGGQVKAPASCITYYWRDERQKTCMSRFADHGTLDCRFRVEVVADGSGRVWAHWDDSF